MTKIQRIGNILTGMMLIIIGIVIFVIPESGYSFAIIIIGLTMTLTGLRLLIYYISMARHMVGGKIMFFIGIICFSLCLHGNHQAFTPASCFLRTVKPVFFQHGNDFIFDRAQ